MTKPRLLLCTVTPGSDVRLGCSLSIPGTAKLPDSLGLMRPGANDVRGLAPGVCFERSAVVGKPRAVSVRKVVIQR